MIFCLKFSILAENIPTKTIFFTDWNLWGETCSRPCQTPLFVGWTGLGLTSCVQLAA